MQFWGQVSLSRMGILGALVLCGLIWWWWSSTQREQAEANAFQASERQRQVHQAVSEDREDRERAHRFEKAVEQGRLYVAYRVRFHHDEAFADRVRKSNREREGAPEEVAAAAYEALRQEALSWFLRFPEHKQRQLRSELMARERAKAFEEIAMRRKSEEVDLEEVAVRARREADPDWEEKYVGLHQAWNAAADKSEADAAIEALSAEALEWVQGLSEAERDSLVDRHKPVSIPERWAALYASKNPLPAGLTERGLAEFLARARDEIEYTDAEKYVGQAQSYDLVEQLEYHLDRPWDELGDRTGLEVLAKPGGDDKLVEVLLKRLDESSDDVRAWWGLPRRE